MSEKRNIRKDGRPTSSVNPQGISEDVANQRPESKLEHKAKKSNTKR
ncbi:small, acid-soluble spore protein L [Aquibacillus rhizosphaerae]|uniref:Small, acid-soluble spore protein L n=1 Tax=Aquibacillus rhizosphaerae TaxID=3051431 RepID=A0ABT7L4Q0_9BACI|nr:small, acid-soluble spore protein L [Aquibacillus sp. LR5S19]MDL4839575.1 small, acid-soluble spore protein L [Aquibacillus sp. LR5S19]